MGLPRKKKKVVLDGMSEHRFWNVGGGSPCFMFLPTVCLWFWKGKQEGEGTQRLLQTQEPRVTQSSVNDIPVEYVKELRVFLLEKGADNVRAIFKYLKGCLSGRVINFY